MVEEITDAKLLDKILKPYFDYVFDGCEYGILKNHGELKYTWRAFYKNKGDEKEFFVGYVLGEPADTNWYSRESSFDGMWYCFSTNRMEFYDAMTRYIRVKFGVSIKKII